MQASACVYGSPRAALQCFFDAVLRSLLILAFALLLGGCRRGEAGGLTLAGSTSVQPFAELLAEEYMLRHPQSPPINVQGGGSTAGIQAAQTGAADIGMSSRELRDDETGLYAITIARDAIAVIVNPRNPVSDLTLEQIRAIFSGQLTNWKAVGGEDHPITLVTREEGSGTRGAFQKLVMGEEEIFGEAIVQDSNGAVRELVASDPHAIGYISLGIADERVKVIKVNGVEPSIESVERGEYLLVRPFLFVLKGEPQGLAKDFIDFVLSPEAQELLAQEGLVRVD